MAEAPCDLVPKPARSPRDSSSSPPWCHTSCHRADAANPCASAVAPLPVACCRSYAVRVSPWETTLASLNASGVRYVVVGGLAVVLHGHARMTADLDLCVDLAPDAARKAMQSLSQTGLRPRAPVAALDFADTEIRSSWVRDKGMQVFSMYDPSNPLREVDVFAVHPIPFEELYANSLRVRVGATETRIPSLSDLVRMKRIAGRPVDLADIEALGALTGDEP